LPGGKANMMASIGKNPLFITCSTQWCRGTPVSKLIASALQ